ncbi:hypothetical protein [Bartonella refiksaydamii]|uniref:hypothetical protein n=1 Tax=Bartonella refiksaydamii TaxID=2654951 RepID=UPI0012EBDE63|nr:hypothetical protein [Bartonella refiksaydamii]
MGSSSSSNDSSSSSHSSSWFHSERCDAGGYAYDVIANGIKGAVVGGAIGIFKGPSGIGYGAAIGAAEQGGNALIDKIDECSHR